MIDRTLIDRINTICQQFLQAVTSLKASGSFRGLLSHLERLRTEWREIEAIAESPRVQKRVATFSCAFVGSTNSGKTSLLAEMFPGLEKRGWLVTDVSDTTSQALVIRLGNPSADRFGEVVVRSWETKQIRRLLNLAEKDNANAGIQVIDHKNSFIVDGENANFDPKDLAGFKFARRLELRPLPRSYTLTSEEAGDPNLIRGLTVKEPSERVRTGPILTIEGQNFNSLQLRTVVKEVELRDDFATIANWTQASTADLASLVFIDTPGLSVTGGVKDEVLRHILANKNRQIVVELIRNDELDILVHLVLCPNQTSFSELWKAVEFQCSADELSDISDRLILAINGTSRYFTEADLRRKWESPEAARREGDHFAVTLEENILKKMSDRGTVSPARICFVDCFRHVNSAGRDYASFYATQRAIMESWNRPGSVCFPTLQRLGLTARFQDNIDALCDPSDRGQGFLARQIVDLVRQNGPKLFTRKYLVRNRLLRTLHQLRAALLRSYETNGALNAEAVRDAVQACLRGLDLAQPATIEDFARANLDSRIESIVPALDEAVDPEKWVIDCFNKLGRAVLESLVQRPHVPQSVRAIFLTFLQERFKRWGHSWGYRTASVPPPTRRDPTSRELILAAIKVHGREMLVQLLLDRSTLDVGNVPQNPEDVAAVGQVIASVEDAIRQAEALCRQYGVTPS